MKAGELLEILSKLDPETEINFAMDLGCCGDIEPMELEQVIQHEHPSFAKFKSLDYFEFRLVPLEGYESCSRVASMKKLAESFNKE